MSRIFNLYVSITFFLFLPCLSVAQQSENKIIPLIKTGQNGIWLRWAPSNPYVWKMGINYGYHIERFKLTGQGDIANAGQPEFETSIRAATKVEMDQLSENSDEIAALEEMTYPDQQPVPQNAPSTWLKTNEDLENRYGTALFLCDLSTSVAHAAGLFIIDSTATLNERYIFRIKINGPVDIEIEPAVMVFSYESEKPLPSFQDVQIEFRDKSAMLTWPVLMHRGVYTAYYIQHSEDGKNFSNLTDLPYVHLSEDDQSPNAYFLDSLEQNNKKYFYRIMGLTPFGETGPPSNIVSGQGKDNLSGTLIIRSGNVLNQELHQLQLEWEFPQEAESQISGLTVSRARASEGPFEDIATLPPGARTFTDRTPYYNTYYTIRATDPDKIVRARSLPFLVQIEDSTPPAIPVEISAALDTMGLVSLKWKPSEDIDLMGYRVFRAANASQDPVEVTHDILTTSSYTDTINMRTLDRLVYYRIIAVDNNFNTSDYSLPVRVSRPDHLPPVPAVFLESELRGDSVYLRWSNSSSEDVSSTNLFRLVDNSPPLLIKMLERKEEIFSERISEQGKTYRYKILVADSSGNISETWSTEFFYETGLREAVSNLHGTADRARHTISLRWKNPSPAEKCFIYRRKNEEPLILYKTLEGDSETFIDQGVSINNTYSYKVQIVFKDGRIKTPLSEEVNVNY